MGKIDQQLLMPLFCRIWEDGNSKGFAGDKDCPDSFNDIIQDIFGKGDSKVKVKMSFEESSKLPFNPQKCEARTYKEGYGVQCQFVPLNGGCLCTRHTNALASIRAKDKSLDLPMGRYNSERPNSSLDGKNQKISWVDSRKPTDKKSKKKVTAKKMRDDLTRWGISHIGLKGRKLTDRYNLEIENRENSENDRNSLSLSEEAEETEGSSNPEEQSIPEESKVILQYQRNDDSNYEVEIHTTQPEHYQNNPLTKSIEKVEEKEEKPVSTDEPKTVADYKNFFLEHEEIIKKKGITLEGVKGRKQHREKYVEIKKAIEEDNQSPQLKLEPEIGLEPDPEQELEPELEPEPEPELEPGPEPELVPETHDSDTEDLSEEEIEYVETSFDGVDYLEVEDNDSDECYLYNLKKQKVGKWNDDSTNILWINDQFRIDHEAMIK